MKVTSNLCLAVTLVSLDMPPDKIEVKELKGRKIAQFVFTETPDVLIAIKKFWSDDLLINPRLYYDNLKQTKNRVYELLKEN